MTCTNHEVSQYAPFYIYKGTRYSRGMNELKKEKDNVLVQDYIVIARAQVIRV
jgi:hypothetical protein